MATLIDQVVLSCYRNALCNWKFDGFVIFMKDAAEGLRTNTVRHETCTRFLTCFGS